MKLVSDETKRELLIKHYASEKVNVLRSQVVPIVDEKKTLKEKLQKTTERLLELEKRLDAINLEISSLQTLL